MAAEPGLQDIYSRLSQARLESAGSLLNQYPNCQYGTETDSIIARCNIAMLIWSAAVDAGSCLMIQEQRRTPGGNSAEITAYVARSVDVMHPGIGIRLLWRSLLQLHNVQHRADHLVERFTASCRISHDAFASINQLLNPASKLNPASFIWLRNFEGA